MQHTLRCKSFSNSFMMYGEFDCELYEIVLTDDCGSFWFCGYFSSKIPDLGVGHHYFISLICQLHVWILVCFYLFWRYGWV